jgi:hypothetical protein
MPPLQAIFEPQSRKGRKGERHQLQQQHYTFSICSSAI